MVMNITLKRLSDQKGLVSIVVTLIVMSILTLIALGFAGLADREQRQATDEQLSSQAFYAAESGVNAAIASPGSFGDNCNTPVPINANVNASCVIVRDGPQERLDYSPVDTNESLLIPIEPTTDLTDLKISWQDFGEVDTFPSGPTSCSHELKDNTWSNTGLLRAMIIPKEFSDRADLTNSTYTMMLYPTTDTECGAGSNEYTVGPTKGGFVNGNCKNSGHTTPQYCSSTIKISMAAGSKYILRLKGIYRSSKVTLTGVGPLGTVLFANAQRRIESTGKANDVLRTIKVTVPIVPNNAIVPEHTLEMVDSLCKRIEIVSGVSSVGAPYTDPTAFPSCSLSP